MSLSMREFAKPLKVTYSAVYHWENCQAPITDIIADAIEKHHSISSRWLLEGVGEMFIGGMYVAESDRFGDTKIANVAKSESDDGYDVPKTENFLRVRFADLKASAGHGNLVDVEPVSHSLLFESQWLHERIGIPYEKLLVLSVDGDSMMPTLNPNDLIMIDTSAIERGFKDGIWVFCMDNAIHVKRVSHRGHGQFTATSDNTAYQPFAIEEPYHFIGRVVWSDKRW